MTFKIVLEIINMVFGKEFNDMANGSDIALIVKKEYEVNNQCDLNHINTIKE